MCGAPAQNHSVLGRRLNTRQGLRPQKKIGIATTIMKCDRCGLVFANPTPVPKSIEQHYGVPPETYWKAEYFAPDPEYLHGVLNCFESVYGKRIKGAGLQALDVGAGIGKAMIALSNAGFLTKGIEPSEPFYRKALEITGIPADRLNLEAVEDAEFEIGTFDFINMAAVAEHFYDPASAIAKASRWLKPGGLIHIEVPSSKYMMSRLARYFYKLTGSDYVVNTCPMHAPYHLYEFTLESFRHHGKANDYRVAHYDYYVCESYMPRLVKPLFNALMKATNTGMQLAAWLKGNN
ncbi:hypothetical protein BH10PLA2_BH10PLA2_15990 [soil metagenome]